MIPKLNEANKKKKDMSKYRAETRMSDSNVGQLHIVKHTLTHANLWSDQAGENIHNDERETWKKSWARFKCFRNERNSIFNENYDGAVVVDVVVRGMVDRWFRSKRSKNLENVAEREKSHCS